MNKLTAHKNDIMVLLDAAQSIGHMKTDVQDLDVDFLTFSAHKMYGPTGVGVLYGKEEVLKNIRPIIFGGGMNSSFGSDLTRIYDELPELLEAGTPNIAGVIGFGKVIEYINKIGLDKIQKHELELKNYENLSSNRMNDNSLGINRELDHLKINDDFSNDEFVEDEFNIIENNSYIDLSDVVGEDGDTDNK